MCSVAGRSSANLRRLVPDDHQSIRRPEALRCRAARPPGSAVHGHDLKRGRRSATALGAGPRSEHVADRAIPGDRDRQIGCAPAVGKVHLQGRRRRPGTLQLRTRGPVPRSSVQMPSVMCTAPRSTDLSSRHPASLRWRSASLIWVRLRTSQRRPNRRRIPAATSAHRSPSPLTPRCPSGRCWIELARNQMIVDRRPHSAAGHSITRSNSRDSDHAPSAEGL